MWSVKRSLTLFILLVCTGLIAGCGFQLRGTVAPLDIGSVKVSSSPEFAPVRSAFVNGLSAQNVVVVSGAASSDMLIEILDVRNYRRPVSTTQAVDAAEYELRQEVDITISTSGDDVTEATLVSERIYSVDSLNLSGSYEEQRMLQREMHDELARMMMRRLEALSRMEFAG